jgi:butyryl-CoA dehydrogenase
MLGHAGYLHSRDYARERRQGRLPDQKDPSSPPVPIIEHADVRRMLLQQKAWTEGAMALAMFAAGLVDRQATGDADQRREAGLLLELLTPVVKAWSAEWCVRANDLAIQVLGGYGYTREFPVEQYWRDNRLNPIHEGANGIQAIDLLGRKVTLADGEALRLLLAEFAATADAAQALPGLAPHAQALRDAAALVAATTATLVAAMAAGRSREALANAPRLVTLLGHAAVAWSWLRQAIAACSLDQPADADFRAGKLAACRWFFVHELPAIALEARLLAALEPTALETRPEWL